MTAARDVVVRNASGLHARPAARFVEEARRFESELRVEKDGRTADCKSVISLLKLGVDRGAPVRIEASGPDEDAALERLLGVLDELAAEEQTTAS